MASIIQITGPQIRAARALLGWSRQDLASQCDISMSALLRLEGALSDSRSSTVGKVVKTLTVAGIEFVNREDISIGVILKTVPPKPDSH